MLRDALVGWALLFAGVVGWVLVAALGWMTAPGSALLPGYGIHAMVLPAPGLLIGLALVVLRSAGRETDDAPLDRTSARAILVIAVLGLVLALAYAVAQTTLSPTRAVMIGVSAVATLMLVFFVVDALRRNEGITFESHWGGLGGGLGGWRVSTAAVLVGLLVIFASATLTIGAYDPKAAKPNAPADKAGAQTPATKAAAPEAKG